MFWLIQTEINANEGFLLTFEQFLPLHKASPEQVRLSSLSV